MDYTLSEVQNKTQEFCDKIGSDYFPLPVFLNRFHTAALDFVDDRLKQFEKNQEVVEDIRPLISTKSISVIPDPNDITRFIAAIPDGYHRILSHSIIYPDKTKSRISDMQKHSEFAINQNNPNRKGSKKYPTILQEANIFVIDSGNIKPATMKMTICNKPTIATTGEPDKRIVNLPDTSIEKIILSTVTMLFAGTGDQRQQSAFQIQEAFRTTFR